MLSDDVVVALRPAQAYARLLALSERRDSNERALSERRASKGRAFLRPALVLLVIGVSSAIAATGRVTVTLVASTMLLWSFVVAVQILTGLVLVSRAPARRVSLATAIDLLFAGHLPWSLWICLVAGWFAAELPFEVEVAGCAGIVALLWTTRILSAFVRTVVDTSRRGRWTRLAAHQAITWFIVLAFAAATSGGWWRLLDP